MQYMLGTFGKGLNVYHSRGLSLVCCSHLTPLPAADVGRGGTSGVNVDLKPTHPSRSRPQLLHPLHPLIHRRKVRCRHVEQLLEAVDDEVGLLVGVDLVARAHGALQAEREALGFGAVDGVLQLAR